MSASINLSPTQQLVAEEVTRAVAQVPVIHLAPPSNDKGISNGRGMTTILRSLASTLPGAVLLDVKASVLETASVSAASKGFDAFINSCISAWEKHEILLIDDIDLACCPKQIDSVRLGQSGESYGFYSTAAEPTLAIKMLCNHATAHGKRLVFRSVEDHFLRFMGQPYTVKFPDFGPNDYAFFLDAWLPAEERAQLGDAAAEKIHQQYPQLSAADLRVICVPPAPTIGEPSASASSETKKLPIIERIAARLAPSHGSVSLEKIDAIDIADMPGLDTVMGAIEKHVLLPFEHPELARQFNAEPKHGVLLFGPPGTGKTSIGRALAHRLKGKMFMVRELNLHRELLVTFAAAEANAPSVVFIDDMDAVMQRDMIQYGQQADIFRFLLAKLDGLASQTASNKHVIVIMACNNVKMLPEALLRSGRIELWLKTELPKQKVRERILETCTMRADGAVLRGADFKAVAKAAVDFTPADLKRVCADARNLLAAEQLKKLPAGGGGDAQAVPAAADVTKCMVSAVEELKEMKANIEMLVQSMYN